MDVAVAFGPQAWLLKNLYLSIINYLSEDSEPKRRSMVVKRHIYV